MQDIKSGIRKGYFGYFLGPSGLDNKDIFRAFVWGGSPRKRPIGFEGISRRRLDEVFYGKKGLF
jgi:hypothetical protein